MNEPTLFDPESTQPRECQHCPAVLEPNQKKTTLCQWEIDRDGRRPRHCLNAHDPATAELPF